MSNQCKSDRQWIMKYLCQYLEEAYMNVFHHSFIHPLIHSFIQSCNKYLLNTSTMHSHILSCGGGKIPVFRKLTFYMRDDK